MAVQQRKNIYKGFTTKNPFKGFKLYDYDLVVQDLLNQLHVRRGERVMMPQVGTIIWNAIFEPLTAELKNALVEDIANIIARDPRLKLDNITVTEYGSGLQFELDVTYVEYNTTGSITLKFDQSGQLMWL